MSEAIARNTDMVTSHMAARTVNTPLHKGYVLKALRALGAATDKEVEAYCQEQGWAATGQSLRSRRRELTDAGRVVYVRRTRGTEGYGRWESVWALAEGERGE